LSATAPGHDHAAKDGNDNDDEDVYGDEDWAKELARRAVVTADRIKRCAIQRLQDAELSKAVSFTSYTASQGESGGEGFIGDSSLAAAGHKRHRRSMMCSPRLPPSRMLPEFGENQAYPCTVKGDVGMFSPMTAPRHNGVHVDLNLSYTASELPDMHRVPNMFAGSSSDATRALFDQMPGAHEVFGEMFGTHMMFIEEEGTAYMNDMIGSGDAGVGGMDVQAEEE
jgi:hypothetical protein